jgi:hypothetical protein
MYLETRDQQPAINLIPSGNGNGDGFGGIGNGTTLFFFLILFFFIIMFMGWGNNGYANGNNGGNGGGNVQYIPYPAPYMMGGYSGNGSAYQAADIIRQGFDQSAVIGGINGLQNQLQAGFSNAEVSRCNQQANLLATMNNNQNATTAALQSQAMAFQNCCCENRAGIADVKYALTTEACADRAAVTNALQALTAQNNANMNAMMTAFNNGIQALKDENCADRLAQKDARIADLERQVLLNAITGTNNAQTQALIASNDAQTAALEQYLAPTPRPAYIVQNPNCCQQNNMSPCPCNRFN